ncbi:MAG: porin [Verrucomicrobia bacterium]|nr:porin [Verrucomicrobiota bacterium]
MNNVIRVEHRLFVSFVFVLAVCGLCCCPSAFGQTVAASPSPAPDGKEVKKIVEAPKPPEPRFKLYGWIEGGLTGNPDSPIDNHNFGHLFTDRANEPLLNQVSIVAERALDPNATGFDWGFKVWFMEGSDARYTKSMGFLDLATNYRIQPDFPEVYISAHIPVGSTGGLDLKVGKYADPMSAETIDPRNNVFYSHSYIFNFGVPFNDTGFLAIFHVNKYIDLYGGLNRGENATFKDNNSSVAFEGGIGLNLLDGNLTTVALTHIGPEDPGNNHDYRFLNDITTTWKVTKALTWITDLNLIYDQLPDAYGFGFAQYFTYAVNDWLILGLRGEVWRDDKGFYVGQFRANNDFIHIERGDPLAPDPSTFFGGRTTYLEVTGGITIKPPVPKPLAALLIRPEVRYDKALSHRGLADNNGPFDQQTSHDQWTLGLDVILQF